MNAMNRTFILLILTLFAGIYTPTTHSLIPAPDFYRTPVFFGKTQSISPCQISFETAAFGGRSTDGFNGCGKNTALLSIYGPENIKDLAQGVPSSILNKNPDSILNTLFESDTSAPFGQINWNGGIIEEFEWDATVLVGLANGFFMEFFLPYRSIDLSDIGYQDLSSESSANLVNYNDWKDFIDALNCNLTLYGLNNSKTSSSGVGDIIAMLGWSSLLYDSCMLHKWKVNAIETTLKFGVSMPTSNTVPFDQVFGLSRGYNGHTAFPLIFNGTLYFRKWISFGAHISGTFFASKKRVIGMKTAHSQNGFIKLAHGKAKIDRGPIWTFGAYMQANIYPGCSFLFGYGYTEEEKTLITPCDKDTFKCTIVNHDKRFDPWNFHMFHFIMEYDFTTCQHPDAPYVNIFISKPFKGERVFDTSMFGATLGINCTWKF
ncbi:hypothetical protein HOM50_02815 [bacterium]|nr:hypothetical protein [bacterium]MBT5015310.1 hypothetical protein [bacterium]